MVDDDGDLFVVAVAVAVDEDDDVNVAPEAPSSSSHIHSPPRWTQPPKTNREGARLQDDGVVGMIAFFGNVAIRLGRNCGLRLSVVTPISIGANGIVNAPCRCGERRPCR